MDEKKMIKLCSKVEELSEAARSMSNELRAIADEFYKYGAMYDKLSGLAMDMDEMSMTLDNKDLLSVKTITCHILGRETEISEGDLIRYVTENGKLSEGYVAASFLIQSDRKDFICMSDMEHGKANKCCRLNQVVNYDCYYKLSQNNWNKIVENLASQKKSVSLSVQNYILDIKVRGQDGDMILELENMPLCDMTREVFEKIRKC